MKFYYAQQHKSFKKTNKYKSSNLSFFFPFLFIYFTSSYIFIVITSYNSQTS